MDTVELLTKFADPQLMKSLSGTERLIAGLITTVLGMGITFVSLVVLQFVTGFMEKFSDKEPAAVEPAAPVKAEEKPVEVTDSRADDEELVAAITTAIAMQLQTSVSNIVIRNIRRIDDHSPVWNKAGISEQLHNKL